MLDLHRLPVAAGTNAKERDAVSMLRVHVRLYLEYKARENGLRRVHDARVAVARLRRGRPLGERVQNLPNAEVVDCRPEENGRLTACKEFGELEWMTCPAYELDVVAKRLHFLGKQLVEPGIGEPFDELGVVAPAVFAGREAHQAIPQQVEDPAKALAHAYRPADRRAVDLQHRFDLLQQRHRLTDFAVKLVYKSDDRGRAQSADFEQLDRLRLDAFGRVDDHDRGVDRRQHSIRIL